MTSRPFGMRQGDIPGVQLRKHAVLPIPPEDSWVWLTTASRLRRWLALRVDIGLQVGAIWNLEGDLPENDGLRERLELLHLEPAKRLRATLERLNSAWGVPTLVDIQILGRGGGCELSVVQSRFEQLPLSIGLTAWETYRRRWTDALKRLQVAVSQEP